jgi:hypothetical protein
LLDNLNLAHQTLKVVLRMPHRQQPTIAPDSECHHGEQEETTTYQN